MRHAIVVVGKKIRDPQSLPDLVLRNKEPIRMSTWFANWSGRADARLLDDLGSIVLRIALAPFLGYKFYTLVHNTKLWSGKRPLVLCCDRGMASRIAAYAGMWGGGDVVKADMAGRAPLGPTRYVLEPDGRLELLGGGKTR